LPDMRVHTYIDRWILGKSYPKIHKEMDRPFKRLGRRHRSMFHDSVSAIAIAQRLYPGDPVAVRAALHHIYFDNICSNNPEFKETLEIVVRLDSIKKRRKNKRKRLEILENRLRRMWCILVA